MMSETIIELDPKWCSECPFAQIYNDFSFNSFDNCGARGGAPSDKEKCPLKNGGIVIVRGKENE
jgi:hypothetical protein